MSKRLLKSKKRKLHRNAIIDAFLYDQPVYVKNTGVQCRVREISEYIERRHSDIYVNITIDSGVNTNLLDKMKSFHINKTTNPNGELRINCSGEINFTQLSTRPFETNAARILHGK